MKPEITTFCATLIALAVLSPVSRAEHEIFVIEDAASAQHFADGVQAAGAVLLGIEDFASSTLADRQGVALSGPVLAPGEANGPFPLGTKTALGLYLQTNELGGSPTITLPDGVLFAQGPDPDGFDFVRVGPDHSSMSLDILVSPPNFPGMVRGLTFRAVVDGGDTAEIRVFDNQNNLLAFETFSESGSASLLIGVLAPPDETFLRVNVWAPSGHGDAGDFEVFAIPAPSSAAHPTLNIAQVGTAEFDDSDTHLSIDFIGVPNQDYQVEYSSNLTEWHSAGTFPTGSTGSFTVTLVREGDFTGEWNSSLFFRVRH